MVTGSMLNASFCVVHLHTHHCSLMLLTDSKTHYTAGLWLVDPVITSLMGICSYSVTLVC